MAHFIFNTNFHCAKIVQIRSFFWSVISCIQSESRKIRTRKNSVFGSFSGRVCTSKRSNSQYNTDFLIVLITKSVRGNNFFLRILLFHPNMQWFILLDAMQQLGKPNTYWKKKLLIKQLRKRVLKVNHLIYMFCLMKTSIPQKIYQEHVIC